MNIIKWFRNLVLIHKRMRRLEEIGRERADLAPKPMDWRGWLKALRRPGVVLAALDEELEIVESIYEQG